MAVRSRKKLTRKKTIRKKFSKFSLKGKATIYLLILVVFLGGLLFSGGLFPKLKLAPANKDDEAILVEQSPVPSHDNLQLDTLKFKRCTETAAIDFLLDRSGSMTGSKLNNLKNAINLFTNKLSDNSVLGIQSFSDPNHPQRVDIPISYYKDVKRIVPSTAESLYAEGSTYMRSAFEMTSQELFSAIDAKNTNGSKKFPDKYKFNLIFISDGVPELLDCNRQQHKDGVCSTDSQNPIINPDISQQIKDRKITIFTIAYLDIIDVGFNDSLEVIMKHIASKDTNGNPYYFRAPINNELTDILAQISTKICSE